MAYAIIDDGILIGIANAIRSKNGEATKYKPSEMPRGILKDGEEDNGMVTAAGILSGTVESVKADSALIVGTGSLNNCTSLRYASFASATELQEKSLYGCSSLVTLVLGANTVCKIPDSSYTYHPFKNTPIGGDGYVYVPRALVDSYKNTTNWKPYANNIRAIEDYPDIVGG